MNENLISLEILQFNEKRRLEKSYTKMPCFEQRLEKLQQYCEKKKNTIAAINKLAK